MVILTCYEGTLYEMGGTWVTHHMAYLFKEMTRYKMDKDLTLTHHRGYGNDYYTINVPGKLPDPYMSRTSSSQDNRRHTPNPHARRSRADNRASMVHLRQCRRPKLPCHLPTAALATRQHPSIPRRSRALRQNLLPRSLRRNQASTIHRRSLDPNSPPPPHHRG